MKREIKLAVGLVVALYSCSHEPSTYVTETQSVAFGAEIVDARAVTRVQDTSFSPDDQIAIGMYDVTLQNLLDGFYTYRPYTIGGKTVLLPDDRTQLLKYPASGNVRFIAYAQANKATTSGHTKINVADQSTAELFEDADYIYANDSTEYSIGQAVGLSFKHRLSKVTVTLKNNGLLDATDKKDMTQATVVWDNTPTMATHELATDQLTASVSGTIKPYRNPTLQSADQAVATAILPPHPNTTQGASVIKVTIGGMDYSISLPQSVIAQGNTYNLFDPSMHYLFDLEYTGNRVRLIHATVAAWENQNVGADVPGHNILEVNRTHLEYDKFAKERRIYVQAYGNGTWHASTNASWIHLQTTEGDANGSLIPLTFKLDECPSTVAAPVTINNGANNAYGRQDTIKIQLEDYILSVSIVQINEEGFKALQPINSVHGTATSDLPVNTKFPCYVRVQKDPNHIIKQLNNGSRTWDAGQHTGLITYATLPKKNENDPTEELRWLGGRATLEFCGMNEEFDPVPVEIGHEPSYFSVDTGTDGKEDLDVALVQDGWHVWYRYANVAELDNGSTAPDGSYVDAPQVDPPRPSSCKWMYSSTGKEWRLPKEEELLAAMNAGRQRNDWAGFNYNNGYFTSTTVNRKTATIYDAGGGNMITAPNGKSDYWLVYVYIFYQNYAEPKLVERSKIYFSYTRCVRDR